MVYVFALHILVHIFVFLLTWMYWLFLTQSCFVLLFSRREHSIFQDGGAPSDCKPLEGILSFGKGVKEVDPFEQGGSYDDED